MLVPWQGGALVPGAHGGSYADLGDRYLQESYFFHQDDELVEVIMT